MPGALFEFAARFLMVTIFIGSGWGTMTLCKNHHVSQSLTFILGAIAACTASTIGIICIGKIASPKSDTMNYIIRYYVERYKSKRKH